jgi:hypothetical protein
LLLNLILLWFVRTRLWGPAAGLASGPTVGCDTTGNDLGQNGRMLQRPGVRNDIPPYLLRVTQQDLAGQTAKWRTTKKWRDWLARYPAVLEALEEEARHHDGSIRREFVHSYADHDAVELFYVAMAWGFGVTNVRWPAQQAILSHPPRAEIEGIAEAVRGSGAEAGWHALFGIHRIAGLGYAFGTKLLYFAGYSSGCPGPRPLILDANVLSALHDAGTGILASGEVRRADYLGYLNLAGQWAASPSWPEGTAEIAEYALFERGRELNDLVASRRKAAG